MWFETLHQSLLQRSNGNKRFDQSRYFLRYPCCILEIHYGLKLCLMIHYILIFVDQKELAQRFERVKSLDLHPTEPW